ncbi:MAG TPA: IS607 family transposase [Bacteroidales bacterium]|nr:IS607 family transposase [Bacteroidales bacterium]
MEQWLTSKDFRQKFQLTSQNLWRWENVGKVKTKTINKRKFYLVEDSNDKNRINVIYCRVSNIKQKLDLERQEKILREYCVSNGFKPDKVITDIASGMNENRKGFNELVDIVINHKVDKVIISYKDRLTRFGFDYFNNLFKKYNTSIEVVNLTKEEDFQNELTEDLISIIHHFSMKMYSNRRKQLKQLKSDLEKVDKKDF